MKQCYNNVIVKDGEKQQQIGAQQTVWRSDESSTELPWNKINCSRFLTHCNVCVCSEITLMGVKRTINNNMQHDADHGDDASDIVVVDITNGCNKKCAATTLKAAPVVLTRIAVMAASASWRQKYWRLQAWPIVRCVLFNEKGSWWRMRWKH